MQALWSMVIGWAGAVDVTEVSNPRQHGSWVTDMAGILDPGDEVAIDARLDRLHVDLGVEVAVVTVDDVVGTPKQFATTLFNHWGIGDSRANTGLLVLMVMGDRRLEMETGYGLEGVLPDGWLGSMQQREMVPRFKAGDFSGGLDAGVWAVDERLRRYGVPADDGSAIATFRTPMSPWLVSGLGSGSVFVGVGGLLAIRRRRDRMCPTCKTFMPMLGEHAEDAHLDEGQQFEEAIGSVDYQVHACPTCEHVRTFKRSKWLSGFTTCPDCGVRARTSSSRTLIHATEYSSGEVEITERCGSCEEEHTYRRSTPRRSSSSSSSSSGSFGGGGSSGGSFGGGSSGGGGAGSSW